MKEKHIQPFVYAYTHAHARTHTGTPGVILKREALSNVPGGGDGMEVPRRSSLAVLLVGA